MSTYDITLQARSGWTCVFDVELDDREHAAVARVAATLNAASGDDGAEMEIAPADPANPERWRF